MSARPASTSASPVELASPPTATSSAVAATTTTGTVDPGLLPQTQVLPPADDAGFGTRALGLWRAIVADNPALAMASFFPVTAYVQVKAGANNASDWQYRLVARYRLDIHALHVRLGANPGAAQYVGIEVPAAQAVWVRPGQEDNKGSYYRVYGTRIMYRLDGRTQSFEVSTLISWRGEWYVVHLGPITTAPGATRR